MTPATTTSCSIAASTAPCRSFLAMFSSDSTLLSGSGTTMCTTLRATASTSTQIFSTWRRKCLFDSATIVRRRCSDGAGKMGRRAVVGFSKKKKKGRHCAVKWFGVF